MLERPSRHRQHLAVEKLTPELSGFLDRQILILGQSGFHHHFAFAIRYKCPDVRTIRLLLAMAGVAMHISSRGFFHSSLYSGPACTTNVSPSSLRRNSFP